MKLTRQMLLVASDNQAEDSASGRLEWAIAQGLL